MSRIDVINVRFLIRGDSFENLRDIFGDEFWCDRHFDDRGGFDENSIEILVNFEDVPKFKREYEKYVNRIVK